MVSFVDTISSDWLSETDDMTGWLKCPRDQRNKLLILMDHVPPSYLPLRPSRQYKSPFLGRVRPPSVLSQTWGMKCSELSRVLSNNSNKLPDVFVSSLGFIFSPGVSVKITAVSVYQLLDPLAPSLLFLSFSLNISIIVAVSSNVLSPCSSDWVR